MPIDENLTMQHQNLINKMRSVDSDNCLFYLTKPSKHLIEKDRLWYIRVLKTMYFLPQSHSTSSQHYTPKEKSSQRKTVHERKKFTKENSSQRKKPSKIFWIGHKEKIWTKNEWDSKIFNSTVFREHISEFLWVFAFNCNTIISNWSNGKNQIKVELLPCPFTFTIHFTLLVCHVQKFVNFLQGKAKKLRPDSLLCHLLSIVVKRLTRHRIGSRRRGTVHRCFQQSVQPKWAIKTK